MTSFELAGRPIGGARSFIIAEAGVNHDGDVAKAHRLVDAAADAGADCVKFQTFDPAQLVSAAARTADYQREQTGTQSQLALLEGLVLPTQAHAELQAHAAERGLLFLSTPFDAGSADLLEALGLPAFKVPSGELTNAPLLRHLARKRRPLLLSTGMATLEEVGAALATIRAVGDVPVALFHCVSNYPAAPADCNLRAMATMRDAFGVPTGWSDHTLDLPITLAAAALGAELIEKHLTLDSTAPGPDHKASLEPEPFAALVAGVRAVEAARGSGVKAPVAAELPIRAVVRRSVHAARGLASGTVLTATDLVLLRPGDGLPPEALDALVGRRLRRDVAAGTALAAADLDA